MGILVASRPKGLILNTTPLSATITNNSGDALVTYASHGLSLGSKIFITSDYSNYNGFWTVIYVSANTFEIADTIFSDSVPYVVDANITFYNPISEHGFSSVHLPIVYKLRSDSFPTNLVDTARTVNTFTNDNGYTKLTLSGDIKSTGSAQTLEFVTLTVNSVEGIYQILNWYSDTSITVDLEYDGGNSFGNCQYYYANYHANIKVYAGITGTGAAIKPVELITEIEAVPDEDSIITVNLNESLKSKLDILLNDPSLATMPRDIHAFCEFYISYAESYDQSLSGYTLGTYTSSYTSDSGNDLYAVNSKLPFKNRYSGYMSEYLGVRKFLTLFETPVLFTGNYYDIAFLNDDFANVELRRERYLNGSLVGTSYDSIPSYAEGVYRMPISQELTEDRIDVSLVCRSTLQALASWTNLLSGTSWTLGANPSITLSTAFEASKALAGTYNSVINQPYEINYDLDLSGVANLASLNMVIISSGGALVGSYEIANGSSSNGNKVGTATIVPSDNGAYVGFIMEIIDALTNVTVDINSVSISATTTLISEVKTIEVNSDCSNQDLYLTWKVYPSGHDYWKFTAEKEYGVDISDVQESTKNINTEWPKSYGEFADTIKQDIKRTSHDTILVRSQNLELDQVQALKYIKTSPLVQIMTSKTDRRTVQVDSGSFVVYSESDKLYGIQFTITYTDEVPSQSL